jgi:MoaA/NifB/PqqE/SkfB family radical SAM enzyme
MIARIRKEDDQFLVYFLESRRMIGINQIGAEIIDLYFNKGLEEALVAKELAKRYAVPFEKALQDVKSFLRIIAEELQPTAFNNTEQTRVSAPIGVELEITTSCNLRCKHCLQSDYGRLFMGIEKYRWIIDTLVDAGVFEVSIIGGEPFSHPQAYDMIRYAHNGGLAVGLTTNGSLITDEEMDRMADMENLSIAVSIDGIEQDHDYIRGKGVFAMVDRTIQNMIKVGIEVEAMFTITSYNIGKYMAVVEYCKELGIVCNFNLFKPFKASHSTLVPDPSKFFEVVMELFAMRQSRNYKIGLSNAAIVSHLLGLPARDECRAGQSGLVIDVRGCMLTCPSLLYCGYYKDTDFPPFDENFVETWKTHPLFTEFKKNGLSGCQARSLIFSGDVRKGDPYDLTAFKVFLEQRRQRLS